MNVSVMIAVCKSDGSWEDNWLELFATDSMAMANDFISEKIAALTSRGGFATTESPWVLKANSTMSHYQSVKFWLNVSFPNAVGGWHHGTGIRTR